MAKSLVGKTLDQSELADLVGSMASLMVFGQGGANIGKTFNLRKLKGVGRLKFKVTPDGAKVIGEHMSEAERLIDRKLQSEDDAAAILRYYYFDRPRLTEADLAKLAKKHGGVGKAIRGKQKRFRFDGNNKKGADAFAKETGGKVMAFIDPTGDEGWYDVRIQEDLDEGLDSDELTDIAGNYNGKFLKKSGNKVSYKFGSAVGAEGFEDAVGNSNPVSVSKDGRVVTVELD